MVRAIAAVAWLGLLGLFSTASAGPLVERDNLDDIKNAYQGIYWDDAYKECKTDDKDGRFAILAEATRMGLDFAALPASNWRVSESAAWNRFFVKDTGGSAGWHSDPASQDRFLAIRNAISQASQFPRKGKRSRSGRIWEGTQISYHCKELIGLNKCQGGVAAYASPPGKTDGWAVVFCPRFFNKLRYLNDITNGKKKQPKDLLAGLQLVSFEHAMFHEWMHCDVLGTKFHIEDMVGDVPGRPTGQKIYGADLCHEWAWKYMTNYPVSVNTLTAYNADNHAWFVTNYWFQVKWGWTSDDGKNWGPGAKPRDLLEIRDDDDEGLFDPDDSATEASIGKKDPGPLANCQKVGDDGYTCDYIGESYADYDKDRQSGFKSAGGCDLTKECWDTYSGGIAINPACTCKCNGQLTPLRDPKCAGWVGSLPDPPAGGPPNGP